MKELTPAERVSLYAKAFPKFPPLQYTDRWVNGIWCLGNDYKSKGPRDENGKPFYGAYPPAYLKRMMAMFPDAERVLHLFSGGLPAGNYTRFDLQGGDVVGDAERLSSYFKKKKFDLIFADPAYSVEDALHYGPPMISRNKVLKECARVLEPGGYIIWLDQVLPMFKKTELCLCGAIGIIRSTNHRFRIATWFRKV